MICGLCQLPIRPIDRPGMRSFGIFVAHGDGVCQDLLREENERLKRELETVSLNAIKNDEALTDEISRLKAALATARAKERERWLSWMESTPYPDPPIKDKPWYSQSCFNDGCTAYRNMLRSALRDEEEK